MPQHWPRDGRFVSISDCYGRLGLTPMAETEQVKRAYIKLAKEFHPDVVDIARREEAEAEFKNIARAYERIVNASPSEKLAAREGRPFAYDPALNMPARPPSAKARALSPLALAFFVSIPVILTITRVTWKYNEHEDFILEYTGRTDGLLNTPSNEWISEDHKPKVKRNWMVPRLQAIWRDLWEQ